MDCAIYNCGLQSERDNGIPQLGHVVFPCVGYFLDDAVKAQPLQDAGNLNRTFLREQTTDGFVLPSVDM